MRQSCNWYRLDPPIPVRTPTPIPGNPAAACSHPVLAPHHPRRQPGGLIHHVHGGPAALVHPDLAARAVDRGRASAYQQTGPSDRAPVHPDLAPRAVNRGRASTYRQTSHRPTTRDHHRRAPTDRAGQTRSPKELAQATKQVLRYTQRVQWERRNGSAAYTESKYQTMRGNGAPPAAL